MCLTHRFSIIVKIAARQAADALAPADPGQHWTQRFQQPPATATAQQQAALVRELEELLTQEWRQKVRQEGWLGF